MTVTSQGSSTRKTNAKKLAEGYSPAKRAVEYFCLFTALALFIYDVVRAGRFMAHAPDSDWTVAALAVPSIFGAILLADLTSGIAHWGLDTWGSTATLVFGLLIRSFREHHVDQTAMTKHDFVETNGDNAMATIPMLAIIALMPISCSGITSVSFHFFVITFSLFIAFTNEFHKWSHQHRPNPIAKFCMANSITLTPKNHRVHHTGAHDHSYCITTGWLNPFLDSINFWRNLESLVTAVTGEIPRANDQALLGVTHEEKFKLTE